MARVNKVEQLQQAPQIQLSFAEAGREALKVYRQKREEAVNILRNALENTAGDLVLNEELKSALKLVLGKGKTKRSVTKSITEDFFSFMKEVGRAKLADTAAKFGVDESKLLTICKSLRKASREENRAFIYFEFKSGELVLEHIGPTAPTGWKELR